MKNNIRDEYFMAKAISLARRAYGMTSPNPPVGCVIIKNNKIISQGFHEGAGLPHAEINALTAAGNRAKGAAMYVTLQPCDHYGKTPPCTDAVIKSGIKKIIIGSMDPNPMTDKKAVKKLRSAGINVITGVCQDMTYELIRPFEKFIRHKMPFVTLKIAESLDGKIASVSGDSKWISSNLSREYVRALRRESDAVMVGINTILKDDPLLLPRIKAKKMPWRIIADSTLKTPLNSQVMKTVKLGRVVIGTTDRAANARKAALFEKKGVFVIKTKPKNGKVDIKTLLAALAERNIMNLLVEGGGTLAGALCDEGLVDKFIFIIAPKIIGGKYSISSIMGKGAKDMSKTLAIKNVEIKRLDNDVIITGYAR